MIVKEGSVNLDLYFAKIYISNIHNLKNQTYSTINYYDNKCKIINLKINSLREKEPLKIFNKTHKKWEMKMTELNETFNDSYKKYMDACRNLEDVIDLLNFND